MMGKGSKQKRLVRKTGALQIMITEEEKSVGTDFLDAAAEQGLADVMSLKYYT